MRSNGILYLIDSNYICKTQQLYIFMNPIKFLFQISRFFILNYIVTYDGSINEYTKKRLKKKTMKYYRKKFKKIQKYYFVFIDRRRTFDWNSMRTSIYIIDITWSCTSFNNTNYLLYWLILCKYAVNYTTITLTNLLHHLISIIHLPNRSLTTWNRGRPFRLKLSEYRKPVQLSGTM